MWSRVRDHVHELVSSAVTRQGHDRVGIECVLSPSAPSGGLTCEGQVPGGERVVRRRGRNWFAKSVLGDLPWPLRAKPGELATVGNAGEMLLVDSDLGMGKGSARIGLLLGPDQERDRPRHRPLHRRLTKLQLSPPREEFGFHSCLAAEGCHTSATL